MTAQTAKKVAKKPANKAAVKPAVKKNFKGKKPYVAAKKQNNFKGKKVAKKPTVVTTAPQKVTVATLEKPIPMPDAIPSPAVAKAKKVTWKKVAQYAIVALIALAFIAMVF